MKHPENNVHQIRHQLPRASVLKRTWRGALYLLLVVVVLLTFSGVGMLLLHSSNGFETSLRQFLQFRMYGYMVQIFLIAVLWFKWESIVSWIVARGLFPASFKNILVERRNRWIGWLLAFEIVMVLFAGSGN